MRYSIIFGGEAGQGINTISEIVSGLLSEKGYFVFNYRDYPSLIRGGNNFNVLTFSDKKISSNESKIDILVALDKNTIDLHKGKLRKDGIIISFEMLKKDFGRNLNIVLSGVVAKSLGIEEDVFIDKIKKDFPYEQVLADAKESYGYDFKSNCCVDKLNNKISIMSGSEGVALGAVNSNLDLYIAYPMTPATGVMGALAKNQVKNNLQVFQAENEIAVVNAGIGASFAGANTMVGTSGGGFDLMSEGLSLQGMCEVPLTVYLASRPGPGTGVPTYTLQSDLDVALRAGHGEFPRIVIAPGDAKEAIEKTNEAIYLANKFGALSVILSDKHLAESQFSFSREIDKSLKVNKREVFGDRVVKASSYEHDKFGNTTEDANLTKKNADARIKKYQNIQKECSKFEMIKIYGKKNSKNLIVGWGSTKGAILDAIDGLDVKFLQVLYMKPMSNEIKKYLEESENVVLIENNLTGQLGRVIREKTGIRIDKRILRYDSRPFLCDELREEIEEKLK